MARYRRIRGSRVDSRCGSTRSRPIAASTRSGAGRGTACRPSTANPQRRPMPPPAAEQRAVVGRALPGGSVGGGSEPRGDVLAARERAARVRRRAPAPARNSARGADPARRARLVGGRDRDVLDTTVAAVNSSLATCSRHAGERDAQLAEPTPDSRCDRGALQSPHGKRGDLDALVALLHDDVTISMPPKPSWFRGRDGVAAFSRGDAWRRERSGESCASPAADELVFAFYRGQAYPLRRLRDPRACSPRWRRVAAVHAFLDRTLLPRFGVPMQLAR